MPIYAGPRLPLVVTQGQLLPAPAVLATRTVPPLPAVAVTR